MYKIAGIIILVSILTSCAGAGPKQTAGHLLGGAAGALVGSQFGGGEGRLLGVAVGALAGSYLGGIVGQQMDQRDRELAQAAMVKTLERAPDHAVRKWRNPNNNHSGAFKVVRTQEMPQNHLVCRDYVHTVIIDGQEEKVHGRACRDMRDVRGEWRVQR